MLKFISFTLITIGLASTIFAEIVVTEVGCNPMGSSSAVPGDLSHEFIEIFNTGPKTVSVTDIYFKTESASSSAAADSNDVVAWRGDSLRDIGMGKNLLYPEQLKPGETAVILGRKYISAPESSWYKLPEGTIVFGTRKTYLRSGGMPNSSSVVYVHVRGHSALSSFNVQRRVNVDPGEGMSWNRVSPDSSDLPQQWVRYVSTPGVLRESVNAGSGIRKLIISEFMAYPKTGGAEWIELFNSSADSVSLSGWRIRTGDREGWFADPSVVLAPNEYAVAVGADYGNDPLLTGRLCKILRTEYWGGLANGGDTMQIKGPDGKLTDSIYYDDSWDIKKGISKERQNGRWTDCCQQSGASPGYPPESCIKQSVINVKIDSRRLKRGCGAPDGVVTITFDYPFNGSVSVYDLKCNQRASLHEEASGAVSMIQWNAICANGRFAETGTYFFEIKSSEMEKRVAFTVLKGCR
ncbi:MAG: lamin tail domain-containing protein [Fibrobacteres bacterium]|nr:lamin tail domain-containing protein [Fibrobacterota bacterium]